MRLDCHVHSHHSPDAFATPEQIVRAAKQRVDAVALCDHDTTKGWREAQRAAKSCGVLVVRGEEVKIVENGKKIGELGLLFLEKEVKPGAFEDVLDQAHDQDALVTMSHPFGHFGWENYSELRKRVKKVDAVEAFNSRTFGPLNRRAAAFAHEHKKPVTAGSDAHFAGEVGLAFMQAEASDLDEFRKKLLKGEAKPFWRHSPLIYSIGSGLKKKIKKMMRV